MHPPIALRSILVYLLTDLDIIRKIQKCNGVFRYRGWLIIIRAGGLIKHGPLCVALHAYSMRGKAID